MKIFQMEILLIKMVNIFKKNQYLKKNKINTYKYINNV